VARTPFALSLLLLALTAACEDDGPGGSSGGSGAASSSSASSGPGAAGGSGGAGDGGAGGSGGSGGGGAGTCDLLDDAPSLGSVTFRVKNDGDLTVYLDGGECSRSYTITAPGIDAEATGVLGVACEQVSPTYRGGFPQDCIAASGIAVEPGQERTFEWGGILREPIAIPEGCGPESEPNAYCERAVTGPAGPLTVHFARYQTLFIDEIGGYDYPTDELPAADVEFTHPTTTDVVVDVSLYSDG
jgi:hypothetical protein